MAGIGVKGAVALVAPKVKTRTLEIAHHLRGIAYGLHKNSPRGGYSPNRTGGERSMAEPEQAPAPDTERLLRLLTTPPKEIPDGYEVLVNYAGQEMGGAFITHDTGELKHYRPRPLGKISVERLKREL